MSATAYISKFKVIELPLSNLYFSPTNPRQTFDEISIEELAADIAKNGLMSPITVRHNPNTEGVEYEIVVGSRRTKAHIVLGIDVPCFVRELSDDIVMEMQFSENLKREDVHPLEEAQAFQYYLESKKLTVQDIAGRLNCSPAFVYSRLKLNHLNDTAKDLLKKGKLSIRVASHIAKFDNEYQEEILKATTSGFGDGVEVWRTENSTLQYIKDYFMTQIKDAPFDYSDERAHNGSCLNCHKNTACNKMLFPEYANDGRCTDRKCWQLKKDEYRDSKIAEVKSTHGDEALFLTTAMWHSDATKEYGVPCEYVRDYEIVPADTEGAKPAICLDSNRHRDEAFKPLEVIHVIHRQERKNEKQEYTTHHFDAYREQFSVIKNQIDSMSDDELLQEVELVNIVQTIENIGSYMYAEYYFKKLHKKHPFTPLNKIALFNDEYDNLKDKDVSREEFVKSKLDAHWVEMKTQMHNLSYNDAFRIHVIRHMPNEEIQAIIKQKLVNRLRMMANDYYRTQNSLPKTQNQ